MLLTWYGKKPGPTSEGLLIHRSVDDQVDGER